MFKAETSLKDLCTPRDFDPAIFMPSPELTLKSPLKDHVAWAYQLYSKPYPSSEEKTRILHGIQHVTRAALYVIPLVNLYRRYGNKAAIDLTEEEIKLLQIALLFHDSARLNEGVDHWDTQSAELLYYYFINVLKVNEETANKICHAIANKDPTDGKFNIYQAIIHDADCLDILRARSKFEAKYLQFYQQCAKHNEKAFKDMNILICEARSIIERQGDSYQQRNLQIKKQFEHENAYDAILQTFQQTKTPTPRLEPAIHSNHYRLFPALSTIRSLDELKEMSFEDKWIEDKETKDIYKNADTLRTAIFRDGIVLARACKHPSTERHKIIEDEKTGTKRVQIDSLAGYDFYKMGRGNTWPARTKKKNGTSKTANYKRSASLLGPSSFTYGNAGYLFSRNLDRIHSINNSNISSGFGKKKNFTTSSLSTTVKEKLWNSLLETQRVGINLPGNKLPNNEIICDIMLDDIKAIYFSHDFNSGQTHYTPILEAIFLQRQYEIMTGRKIPIFEYSGIHSDITYRGEYSDDEIVEMWVKMTSIYMTETNNLEDLMDIEKIKLFSMYKPPYNTQSESESHRISFHSKPADSNYPKELQQKINAAIQRQRDKILKQRKEFIVKNLLESKEINFLEDVIYQTLITNPIILDQNSSIKMKLEDFIKKTNINRLFVLKPYLSLVKILKDDKQIALMKCKITIFLLNHFEELKKDKYLGSLRQDILEVCHELNLKHVEEKFLTKTIPTIIKHHLNTPINPDYCYSSLNSMILIAKYLDKKAPHEILNLILQVISKTLTLINHNTEKFNFNITYTLVKYLRLANILNANFPNIIPFKQQRDLLSLHPWFFKDSFSSLFALTNEAFLEKDKNFFIKIAEHYGYDNIQELKERFTTFSNWQVEAILEEHPLSGQKNIESFIQFLSEHRDSCNNPTMLKIIINRLYAAETVGNYAQYIKQLQAIFSEVIFPQPKPAYFLINHYDSQMSHSSESKIHFLFSSKDKTIDLKKAPEEKQTGQVPLLIQEPGLVTQPSRYSMRNNILDPIRFFRLLKIKLSSKSRTDRVLLNRPSR